MPNFARSRVHVFKTCASIIDVLSFYLTFPCLIFPFVVYTSATLSLRENIKYYRYFPPKPGHRLFKRQLRGPVDPEHRLPKTRETS